MINLTDKAKAYIEKLIVDVDTDNNLHISVVGGGCSGMEYRMQFLSDGHASSKDKVFDQGTFKVIVDQKSHIFLDGTTLDYQDGLEGQGFVFNNPMAKRSCGCGKSFCA